MAARKIFVDLPNHIHYASEADDVAVPAGNCVPGDMKAVLSAGGFEQEAARELKDEVAELRQEIVEHHKRLLELVGSRLEAISLCPWSGRPQAGTRVDTPPLSPIPQKIPEKLVVRCKNNSNSYMGCYVLQQGRRVNNFPSWKKDGGDFILFSTKAGLWAISKEGCCDDPEHDPLAIRCQRPHGGLMPDKAKSGDYEFFQSKWTGVRPFKIRIYSDTAKFYSSEDSARGQVPPTPGAPMVAPWSPAPISTASTRSALMEKPGVPALRRQRTRSDPFLSRKESRNFFGSADPPSNPAPTIEDPITDFVSSTSEMQKQPSMLERISDMSMPMPSPAGRRTVISRLRRSASHSSTAQRKRTSAIFANVDDMKMQLHRQLFKNDNARELMYKQEGWAQGLVRSKYFEYFTLAVITTNAMWIGYDVDKNPSDALPAAPPFFQVFENLFCFYFTGEVIVRFMAYRRTQDVCMDPQWLFDFFLVVLMIAETWLVYIIAAVSPSTGQASSGAGALSILRMLRLTRMARLARLFRAVPELMVLVKGMSVAFRSMFWTLVLLFMVIYVFAVAFKILTKGSPLEPVMFSTLLDSMSTLLLPGLLPDSAEIIYGIGEEHTAYAALFLFFVVVGTWGVLNMLIGVMVEGVSAVAAVEKEASTMNFVKTELRALLDSLDSDCNAKISKWEVGDILLNPEACRLINNVGVDVAGLVEIADFHLFNKRNEISFAEFVELVLQLRGNNSATVRDIVNLRKFFTEELDSAINFLIEQLPPKTSTIEQRPGSQRPGSSASGWVAPEQPIPGDGGFRPSDKRRVSRRSSEPHDVAVATANLGGRSRPPSAAGPVEEYEV